MHQSTFVDLSVTDSHLCVCVCVGGGGGGGVGGVAYMCAYECVCGGGGGVTKCLVGPLMAVTL